MVAYDGNTIDYEENSGNPTGDGTWTYTWEHGRQLASMSNGTTAWSFTYDANGMRTSRSSSTASYTYVYNGGQLSKMTYSGLSNVTMYFTYDASGRPAVVTYDDVPYYYVTNLQGDVVAILNSAGTAVVQYTYDAWGKLLSTTGTMASTLGAYNPLRYRSYVYDAELGLYYLQSRYYNPTIGRFLNADALVSTGQGVLGNNMFAYCRNNPIILEDATGTADRACIYAEGRIDDEPWRDHSPGGGGIPRRNYSSGSSYYGEVADKFYTVRFLRVVGKGLGIGINWLYNAYSEAIVRQQNAQMQNSMALTEGCEILLDHPEESIDLAIGIGSATKLIYSVSIALVAGNPVSGSIIIPAALAAWGLYRGVKGIIVAITE